MTPYPTKILMVAAMLATGALAGCMGGNDANARGGDGLQADLLESGSSFVYPLAQEWAKTFTQQNPGVKISTNAGGSGKGKTDISGRLVDIAGTDSVMKDEDIQAAGGDILHIPVAAGAVVIAYNLPGGPNGLKFDSETIARIFLGEITRWNDPALVALNPGVNLPNEDMYVVHRSDGSGTTDTFTDYLSKANADWKERVGKGSSVDWPCERVQPACTGASGNNGVGQQVKTIPYSLSYLGGEWADITSVQTGVIKNEAGNFVQANSDTVGASVAAAVESGAFDDQLRGSAVNQGCEDCYPIAAVTWFLVHKEQPDAQKGKAIAEFLWYVIHDGQEINAQLKYNPIPEAVVKKAEEKINSMTSNGQPLR